MDRRKFLIGAGGAAISGSAILGSGAFTRVESQRRVIIEVAEDPDAYLGLDECPESPNQSYADIDEDGHLEIDMSPDNPTEVGGEGVNSDSFTFADDVFEVCNNGKQEAVLWIESSDAEDLDDPPEEYEDDLPRVQFYILDEEGDIQRISAENQDEAVDNEWFTSIEEGGCVCVGIRTMTKGLETGDQLIDDDEVVIHANADLVGDENGGNGDDNGD
ncbi:DUF1102 domain-containing protein [Salinarchaeum sp. IM2453]|uniref:DUF1102 domain-containing protein n=1 Tax=Salinarchaeum sp. IM2453 TaxID=2862870 RepID=UPI001C82CB74|nr:DUF1102 domain-containing protein [Salinarchaeum sp. IM2453]QZA88515.1 DUF1102 domain-containing protein [Salinarchaeum sp. IM2453]